MSSKQIILVSIALGLPFITLSIFFLSPLSSEAIDLESLFGLVVLGLIVSSIVMLSVTLIMACCSLANRLGYEQMSGLLLLLPGINLLIFFLWAFRESPNEKALYRRSKRSDST